MQLVLDDQSGRDAATDAEQVPDHRVPRQLSKLVYRPDQQRWRLVVDALVDH